MAKLSREATSANMSTKTQFVNLKPTALKNPNEFSCLLLHQLPLLALISVELPILLVRLVTIGTRCMVTEPAVQAGLATQLLGAEVGELRIGTLKGQSLGKVAKVKKTLKTTGFGLPFTQRVFKVPGSQLTHSAWFKDFPQTFGVQRLHFSNTGSKALVQSPLPKNVKNHSQKWLK